MSKKEKFDLVKELKELKLTIEDLSGKPREFKDIKIYPCLVKDMASFYWAISFFKIRKVWYNSIIEVFRMDYLQFLNYIFTGELKQKLDSIEEYKESDEGFGSKKRYKELKDVNEDMVLKFRYFIQMSTRCSNLYLKKQGNVYFLSLEFEDKTIDLKSKEVLELIYHIFQINGHMYDIDINYDFYLDIEKSKTKSKKKNSKVQFIDLIILYKTLYPNIKYEELLEKPICSFNLELDSKKQLIESLRHGSLIGKVEDSSKLPQIYEPIETDLSYDKYLMTYKQALDKF